MPRSKPASGLPAITTGGSAICCKRPSACRIARPPGRLYAVLLPDGATRDRVMAACKAQGVATAIYYPKPLHHQPAYAEHHTGGRLPVSEDVATRIMALPIHPDLTETQLDHVCGRGDRRPRPACLRLRDRRTDMAPPAFSRDSTGSRREPLPGDRALWLRLSGAQRGATRCIGSRPANPRGLPALFLHGGPGAGAGSVHRRFFDPRLWRVVLFDQRGAGRSRPLGALEDNTTDHLVADIEALRSHLGIERWLLFGGSWGSTLAISYAQAHPDRVTACVLRGIFLGRDSEVDWFLHGVRAIFPDAHDQFLGYLPEAERGDLLGAYRRRLNDPDPRVHGPAARAWSVYEGSCSTLLPHPETVSTFARDPWRP